MTSRILKLCTAATIAAALLSSFPACAEARLASKSAPAEVKSPPDTAKSPATAAKAPPPAHEAATKSEEGSRLCIGRLIEMLRSRTAA